MKIEFFFDYLSPYAYLAWCLLPAWRKALPSVEIKSTPVLFAGLLNHWGQKGPAEVAPKRDYVFTHCLRIATRNKIPFALPKFHPFVPVTSLRLSLLEVAGDKQNDVIAALWKAGWQQGRDLGDFNILAEILSENNLSTALLEKTNDPQIKQILKDNTNRAIELGVFGVPSFITEDKTLFWGLDSLVDLKDYLQGNNKLEPQHLANVINRQSAAQRIPK